MGFTQLEVYYIFIPHNFKKSSFCKNKNIADYLIVLSSDYKNEK